MTALPEAARDIPDAGARGKYGEYANISEETGVSSLGRPTVICPAFLHT